MQYGKYIKHNLQSGALNIDPFPAYLNPKLFSTVEALFVGVN